MRNDRQGPEAMTEATMTGAEAPCVSPDAESEAQARLALMRERQVTDDMLVSWVLDDFEEYADEHGVGLGKSRRENLADARAALARMQAAQQAVEAERDELRVVAEHTKALHDQVLRSRDGMRKQRDHECERSNLFAGFIRATPGLLDKYDAYARMAALEPRP